MDLASDPAITGVIVENNGVNGLSLDHGTLAGDGFWDDPDIVYLLTGDTYVPIGSTLTVGAGQVIKVKEWTYDLVVEGTLLAVGTAAAPIVFTSERDDTVGNDTNNNGDENAPYRGSWSGIQLAGTSAGSVMDYVDVRYGGSSYPANVWVNGGELNLTNSTLRESSAGGLRIVSSNPTLTDNVYRNNSGSAITMDLASNPAIVGVTVENNGVNGLSLDHGTLAGDGFWDDADIVYRLTGDTIVPVGSTLTVGEGQVVKVEEWTYDLIVEGTLLADGTAVAPIVFTSERDDTVGNDTNNNGDENAPYRGSWSGIQLAGTSTGSVMDYVDVRYGGSSYPANVYVNGGELTLTNSTLQESSAEGLRIVSSNPTLTDNVYRNNSGSAIAMDLTSDPAIIGATVENNGTNGLSLDPGTLGGDGFWDDPDIVYRLTGDTIVPDGSTLTVGAGQVVKVGEWSYDLVVEGTLLADGTAVAPIVFTSERDDTVGNDTNNNGDANGPYRGSWSGIQLAATSTGSVMDYVDVRYGGSSYPANVYVNGGELTIRNCRVSDSSAGGVLAVNDAEVRVENSLVLQNGQAGILAASGTTMTAVNNTIDSNDTGFDIDSAAATMVNNLITYNTGRGVRSAGAATLTIRHNNVFNPGGLNYEGLVDATGVNGNRSRDPKYRGREHGDYRLDSGSPAIDSGSSDEAPVTDISGNPRYDDPRVANRGSGAVPWYDMGAYERVRPSTSDLDLQVLSVSGPSAGTANEVASFSWSVTNSDSGKAIGPWTDAVFLSRGNSELDADDILVGTLFHEGSLGPGASYEASADLRLPGGVPADYQILVMTDYHDDIFEAENESNNVTHGATSLELDVTELIPGVSVAGTFSGRGEMRLYRVYALPGQELVVTLDGASEAAQHELLVRLGKIPSSVSYTACSDPLVPSSDVVLRIPETEGGEYFVSAVVDEASSYPDAYSIRADFPDFSVTAVSPGEVGNAGSVTFAIEGARLTDVMSVQLTGPGGGVITSSGVRVQDSGLIYASFDLADSPAGMYDVSVRRTDGTTTGLGGAVTVEAGGSAEPWFELLGPSRARSGRTMTYTLSYGNRGNVDAPAQLIVVDVPDDLGFSLTPNGLPQMGDFLLYGIADSSVGYVLPPGSRIDQQIYVTAPLGTTTVEVTAYMAPFDHPELRAQSIDWNGLEADARPEGYSDEDWTALWTGLTDAFGGTLGEAVDVALADAVANIERGQAGVPAWMPMALEVGRAQADIDADVATAAAQLDSVLKATAENKGRVWAIVVGAADAGGNNDLPGTGVDADQVALYLGKQGANVNQVDVLIDRAGRNDDNIGSSQIEAAFNAMKGKIGPDDTFVFYFSGHGSLSLSGSANLETRLGNVQDSTLARWVQAMNCKNRVVILDCCYAGGFLDEFAGDNKTLVLGASKADQTAGEEGFLVRQAVFTSALLKALLNKKNDADGNGCVSMREGFEVAQKEASGRWFTSQDPVSGGGLPDVCIGDRALPLIRSLWWARWFYYVFSTASPQYSASRSVSTNVRTSWDPNDKTGAAGVSQEHYVADGQTIHYLIRFENQATATLPAAQVRITDPLDGNLDWTTFEVVGAGFSGQDFSAPADASFYSSRELSYDGSLGVDIDVRLDPDDGVLTAAFDTVDMLTGVPPADDLLGFLPPNNEEHVGEGYIAFTIQPKRGLPSGTRIENTASIVFDFNPPIVTNVEFNTVDTSPPSSAVGALLNVSPSTGFDVSWSGDDAGGSGIASYDVYVSDDGGPYQLWKDAVVETSAVFAGEAGHTYAFYSVAVDNVGLREAAPAAADTQTTVSLVANLGPVDYRFLGQLNLGGDSLYYQMETVYNGLCTLQIDVPEPADSARLRLYDADPVATTGLTPLAESSLDVDGNQRIERAVNSGEVYYVEVYGDTTDCDFRLANLLSQVGDVVTVRGTAGDDVIKFDAAASRTITINGIAYHREDSEVATVDFTGGDGFDVAWLHDSSGNEAVEAWPDRAVVTNGAGDSIPDYVVNVAEIESLLAYATRGGNDTATFHGSAGADKLKSYEDSLRLRAKDSSYAIRAKRFDTVVCDSGFAGNDLAVFKGTDGNETLTYVGSENAARIEAANRDHSARGFGAVVARAEGGTGDMSYFTDTAEDDVFYFKSHKTVLVSPQAKITVRAFDEVHATANEGGFDVARIYDTEGDEHLEVSGDTARLYRRNGSELDLIYAAIGFERVKAYSTEGDDTKGIQDHTLELLLYGWDE
jgi:hypothetical protein